MQTPYAMVCQQVPLSLSTNDAPFRKQQQSTQAMWDKSTLWIHSVEDPMSYRVPKKVDVR